MRANYQILPFFKDIKETSLYSKQGSNVSLSSHFKIYTEFNKLLPFICEVNSDCNFEVIVKDFEGNSCGQIGKNQIKHKVFTSKGKSYLVYSGDAIGCLELGECKLPYSITIGDFHSEWFWVANNTDKLLRLDIGNSTDFSLIPYSKGFRQFFYIDCDLGNPEVDSFSVSNRDAKGKVTTTYQKLTETFNLYFNNVPNHIKQVFHSFEVLDFVKLSTSRYSNEDDIICEEKQAKVKSKRNDLGFSFFDLELSIINSEYEEIGVCETSNFVSTNCEVLNTDDSNCVLDAIKIVEIDCNPTSEINDVLVDCKNELIDELLFYATVTY